MGALFDVFQVPTAIYRGKILQIVGHTKARGNLSSFHGKSVLSIAAADGCICVLEKYQ